jgi:hypothetical protein
LPNSCNFFAPSISVDPAGRDEWVVSGWTTTSSELHRGSWNEESTSSVLTELVIVNALFESVSDEEATQVHVGFFGGMHL